MKTKRNPAIVQQTRQGRTVFAIAGTSKWFTSRARAEEHLTGGGPKMKRKYAKATKPSRAVDAWVEADEKTRARWNGISPFRTWFDRWEEGKHLVGVAYDKLGPNGARIAWYDEDARGSMYTSKEEDISRLDKISFRDAAYIVGDRNGRWTDVKSGEAKLKAWLDKQKQIL